MAIMTFKVLEVPVTVFTTCNLESFRCSRQHHEVISNDLHHDDTDVNNETIVVNTM